MKLGLKQILFSEIQQKQVIKLDEAYQIAKDNGYDYENAKRRLRELMNKELIEPIRNEKRIITGYRYISKERPAIEILQFNQGAMKL